MVPDFLSDSFLFASVVTSGIRVLCKLSWDRRDRFVLASAMTFGFGEGPFNWSHSFFLCKKLNF